MSGDVVIPTHVTQDGPASRLIAKIRDELHHAADNGHRLDPACAWGRTHPAVRVDYIEAAIEGFMRGEGWIK